jgi:ATP-dependent DNA ligase
MIEPMLAKPMSKGNIVDWNDWAIEEKFDGHRLIVEVAPGVPPLAHTRPRKHAGDVSGKSMNTKELPAHLASALAMLPAGVYDGELLGGETSTDVTRTDLAHTLRFVVFDVLRLDRRGERTPDDQNTMRLSYDDRRSLLESIFEPLDADARRMFGQAIGPVSLAQNLALSCEADVTAFVKRIWDRGGEGAILKRRAARYQAGKRSPDFIKVKKCLTAVMTVVGFEATKGKVMNRGAFATVVLEDAAGNRTSVKTKDDGEIASFNKDWERVASSVAGARGRHPAIGRQLRIEYQDWTPKGGYRHPRWDRWEDE